MPSAPLDFSWAQRDTTTGTHPTEILPPPPSTSRAPAQTFSLDLMGGIPRSEMPGEGTRRWGHVPVDDDTLGATEELLLAGRPSARAQLSLFRAFERWKDVNPRLPSAPGEVLAIFGGYLYEHDLKASTCGTYVRTALSYLRRSIVNHPEPKWYLAFDILKGLDRMACREERHHAVDIDEDRALEILNSIREQDVAFTIWLLLVCGARCADLARLSPSQVLIVGNRIQIHFRETKTVARPIDQYSVDLELWIPFREVWRPFLTDREKLPADCRRVDDVLRRANCEERTYSFRRLFVNRIIHRFTENGVTDWLRVIELTGHKRQQTARGLYKSHLALAGPLDFSWA